MGDVVRDTIKSIDAGSTSILGVTYGSNHPIPKPGTFLSRHDAASTPTLYHSASSGRFITCCIDLDAPFPSFPFLSPILHYIQSDLIPSSQPTTTDDGTKYELKVENDVKPICAYTGPRPPPISAQHRYVFLLYEQPIDFEKNELSLPEELGIKDRVMWNQKEFEKKAGLGKVVASNYFVSK
jgi:phosphatidylethanolamine-binding protein (PEBP) family uncharacterized protein